MNEDLFLKLRDEPLAFDAFFRFYYPKLLVYCKLILDEDSANDVVQDVFVYIWQKRDRLDFSAGFRSYLFQCAYSRCLDVLKHNNLVQKKVQKPSASLLDDELAWLKGHQNDVIEDLFKKDLLARIDELILDLPLNRRKVFVLSFKKGLSNNEIADALGMPKRTVESHLYLTLKYLREKLSAMQMTIILGCICGFLHILEK